MSTVKIKTTTGKNVQVETAEIVSAAVDMLAAIFAENHSVIVWGDSNKARFAIVPYNSKMHSDEN